MQKKRQKKVGVHTVSLTNGWNLTKLVQIHHQDGGEEVIRFWRPRPYFQGHYIINTQKGA